jgi:hypothetical protein
MAEKSGGLMAQQIAGQRPIRSKALNNMRLALMTPTADLNLDAELQGMSDAQRQQILSMATMIRMGGNDGRSWAKVVRSMYPSMDTRQAQIIAAVLQDTSPVDETQVKPELNLTEPAQNQWAILKPVEEMLGIEPYTYTKPPRDMPLVDRKAQVSQVYETPKDQAPSQLNFDGSAWTKYLDAVGHIESGNRYNIMGGANGHYAGRFQLGADALKDASRIIGYDVTDRKALLANPVKQDEAMAAYTKANHQTLLSKSDKYKSLPPNEQLAILGYAHNQGAGGAVEYLETGQTGSDAFGTKGSRYVSAVRKALST